MRHASSNFRDLLAAFRSLDLSEWSVLIAGASLLVGLAGVFIAIWVYRLQARAQRKLASDQGALRSAKLNITIGADGFYQRMFMSIPKTEHYIPQINLPIILNNTGNKSSKGVTIYVKISKAISAPPWVEYRINKTSIADLIGVKYADTTDGGFSTLIYQISNLQPHIVPIIDIPLFIYSESDVRLETEAETKDHVKVLVRSSIRVAFSVSVLVADDEGNTASASCKLEFVYGGRDELREYIDKYNEDSSNAGENKIKWNLRSIINYIRGSEKVSMYKATAIILAKGRVDSRPELPLEYFSLEGGTWMEGVVSNEAFWFPALSTSFFGEGRFHHHQSPAK